jgi:outer membrane biogenesis lipoprotein LolB
VSATPLERLREWVDGHPSRHVRVEIRKGQLRTIAEVWSTDGERCTVATSGHDSPNITRAMMATASAVLAQINGKSDPTSRSDSK